MFVNNANGSLIFYTFIENSEKVIQINDYGPFAQSLRKKINDLFFCFCFNVSTSIKCHGMKMLFNFCNSVSSMYWDCVFCEFLVRCNVELGKWVVFISFTSSWTLLMKNVNLYTPNQESINSGSKLFAYEFMSAAQFSQKSANSLWIHLRQTNETTLLM